MYTNEAPSVWMTINYFFALCSQRIHYIRTFVHSASLFFNLNQTDTRIRIIASFLNQYDPSKIMVVSARQYGQRPARMFAEAIGANSAVGRFIPGSLTNPALRSYKEPDVLFVTDPASDQQSLREAVNTGLPIVGLVDANNKLRNVDVALPANNKSRHSLALIYWLLSREVLKLRGETTDDAWAEANDLEDWKSTF